MGEWQPDFLHKRLKQEPLISWKLREVQPPVKKGNIPCISGPEWFNNALCFIGLDGGFQVRYYLPTSPKTDGHAQRDPKRAPACLALFLEN